MSQRYLTVGCGCEDPPLRGLGDGGGLITRGQPGAFPHIVLYRSGPQVLRGGCRGIYTSLGLTSRGLGSLYKPMGPSPDGEVLGRPWQRLYSSHGKGLSTKTNNDLYDDSYSGQHVMRKRRRHIPWRVTVENCI